MTSVLRIRVAGTRGQTIALTLTGEMDLTTATGLHHNVENVLGDHLTVILELSSVTFCDSSGLNTLIRLRHRAHPSPPLPRLSARRAPSPEPAAALQPCPR
ncbi:STAS domain-containing protein [Streptomyces sp. NPDC056437]|uniref:STAS domain-containing protein n=1 Tax=Streptomyces sp. NPDC056437 TaxID=3345816 RepID=UPI0036972A93